MARAVFALVLLAWPVTLTAQSQVSSESRVLSRRMEREFIEHLRWEILWSERGIRVPPNGVARLAVYVTDKSLYYCSRDLSLCAEYRISTWDRHLDDRIHSVECSPDSSTCRDGQDEMDSLMNYVRQRNPSLPPPQPPQSPTIGGDIIGPMISGQMAIRGPMIVDLGRRADIVEHFRQMQPLELHRLKEAVAEMRGGGWSSVIIPCFAIEASPVVPLYGERPDRGPVIFSVRWDRDEEEWFGGGQIEPPTGYTPEEIRRIEERRSIFESIKCATVEFE